MSHMHFFLLFDEVLALFSGQEDFRSIGQSVDKRRLLTTVPQLNGLHTDLKEQIVKYENYQNKYVNLTKHQKKKK